jgi:hypothetical protein
MVCPHLSSLEHALIASGARETYRGQAWSKNCREWVYFDVRLDLDALASRFGLLAPVGVHENTDPRSGLERGFVCSECNDAVMGRLEGGRVFR